MFLFGGQNKQLHFKIRRITVHLRSRIEQNNLELKVNNILQ